MNQPRIRIILGCGVLVAAGVVGCAEERENTSIILRVANWSGPQTDRRFLTLEREIREGFERQHPGVRVRFEDIPGEGQYVPKLLMSYVSGNPPDVMHLDASSAAVFINNNLLLDLTPLIEGDRSFELDAYFANVVNIARRGDKLYAIPLDFTPMIMYYNKRLFDEFLFRIDLSSEAESPLPEELDNGNVSNALRQAFEGFGLALSDKTALEVELAGSRWGLTDRGQAYTIRKGVRDRKNTLGVFRDQGLAPYPQDGWTWPEFLETAKTLTILEPGRSSPRRYGLAFANWMPGWIVWIWLNGGDVLSPDGRHAEGYFNSPQSLEAVQFLIDLITKHRIAPSMSESAAAGVDLFRAQRAAMNISGHWMMIEYRRDRLDIGVVSLPTNIGKPVTVIYEAGLAISRESQHIDLAWEWIRYITSEETQKRRVRSGLAISAYQAVARHYAGDPIEAAFLEQVQYARSPWGARVEPYAMVEDLGQEMIDDALYGTPVVEAVNRATRLIESELNPQ